MSNVTFNPALRNGKPYLTLRDVYNMLLNNRKPKWLYRLESGDPEKGLWYNAEGKYVWTIGELPDCETKDLPMGYDPRYHRDGWNGFSSCSNKEDLKHWFSLKDANDLIEKGFVFARYLATEYVEYEKETVFIKETCIAREEIDINELFKEVLK